MNITKANIKSIRNDLDSALAEVGKKYGLVISTGNIRYSATELRTKLTAAVVSGDSKVVSISPKDAVMEADFNRNKSRWGLNNVNVGQTVMYGGTAYKLIGSKASRPKYPLVVEGVRGGRYKLPLSAIN